MDTLRGAAVVAVVVMHAELAVVSATGRELPLLHALNAVLGPVRMPLLVFLSGLLVPRSLAKGLRNHLRGKLVHILWPYAVWSLLDVAHVQLDALSWGQPLRWELLGQLLYDPHTYLWFLAYLFVFHLVAGLLPAPLRTAAVPPVFLLAAHVDPFGSAHKFLWLLGFFLLGDAAARLGAGRVPAPLARAAAYVRIGPLAAVGRDSLVFYACHLLVMTYAVRVLVAFGLVQPALLWGSAVALALGSGWLLARARGNRVVDALFCYPRHDVPANHLHVTSRRINLPV